MSLDAPVARRAWHPLVGAGLVTVPSVLVLVLALVPAVGGPGAAGVSAFLVMGAVAGFSVSGST